MSASSNPSPRCPTIYGPKQSRRQGLSLGINLGDPEQKCCTWSCVYCQCGYGTKADAPTRVPSRTEVLTALVTALDQHPDLDSVTFAGNSEPTRHPEFLEIVEAIRAFRTRRGEKWIFNLLSNGSELDRESVLKACELLDEAWIKVDCGLEGGEALFQRLNRPLARVGSVAEHVERIRRLKQPRIQTLLWQDEGPIQGGARPSGDLSNSTEANQAGLLLAYDRIRPIQIHLTTVQRDPATPGIAPISETALEAFAERVRQRGFQVQVYPA